MIYTNDDYIRSVLKKRDSDSHKGDFGKILIFAGSPGMAGAAILCGKAALKTGAGLVSFLLPRIPCEIYTILQTAVPEATCVAFTDGLNFDDYDAIIAGCGIGQSDISKKILSSILKKYGFQESNKKKTLVLDADALNLISADGSHICTSSEGESQADEDDPSLTELVRASKADIIITPHPGEAKRLLDTCESIFGLSARKNAVLSLSEKYDCIAILKGAGTLIADVSSHAASGSPENAEHLKNKGLYKSREIYENTTGNPGMATGGSGDVLSGITGSLAGQGYAPLDAARLGVFIHGKAGDIAAEKLGEMCVTAGDIADNIALAIKEYY